VPRYGRARDRGLGDSIPYAVGAAPTKALKLSSPGATVVFEDMPEFATLGEMATVVIREVMTSSDMIFAVRCQCDFA
jgi:hypothetical protein